MIHVQVPPDELVVRADGHADPQAVAAVAERAAGRARDVLVLVHGWNETPATAAHLYRTLTGRLAERIAARPAVPRSIAAVGVVWPSVKWADVDGAGSGASLGDDVLRLHETITETADGVLAAQLRALTTVLDTTAGRRRFVETLRQRLPDAARVADDDALPAALAGGDTEELFTAVAEAADATAPGPVAAVGGRDLPGGADLGAGVGWGLPDLPDLSWLVLARRLIDLTSYYEMKARAGRVGTGGVALLVAALQARGVRVHLAGHSFGARVVACTAAASSRPVQSLTLLQGAFSHVGFAPATGGREAGAFRRAVSDGVAGPTVVTHTHNDRAVTLAYAIASRVARQAFGALGDGDDPYGGIGANGAVRTPEAVAGRLGPADTSYAFTPGCVHNLRADRYVAGHADIRGPEVANALLQAILAE